MSDYKVSGDCLVLYIIEHDRYRKDTDAHIFVLYDNLTKDFLIRGNRISKYSKDKPYSYICKSVHHVCNFLEIAIDKQNLWTTEIYNYDNLPLYNDSITFDILFESKEKKRLIAAYDNQSYVRNDLKQLLYVVKNINNRYYLNMPNDEECENDSKVY